MSRKKKNSQWIPFPVRFAWALCEPDIQLKDIDGKVYVWQADLERILAKARVEGRFCEELEDDEEMQSLLATAISDADDVSCQEDIYGGSNILKDNLDVKPMYRLTPGCYTAIVTALELVPGYDLHEGFFINYILEDNFGNLYDYKEFFHSDASNERYHALTEYLGKAGNIVGVYCELVGVCEELTLTRVGDSQELRICERKFIGNLDYIGQNVG